LKDRSDGLDLAKNSRTMQDLRSVLRIVKEYACVLCEKEVSRLEISEKIKSMEYVFYL
jgi:hypothetical protein